MNTHDISQHFEADGSPRIIASRTDGECCSVASGSACIPMPQLSPEAQQRIKRFKRRRFVMKWLQKLPRFKP